MATCHLDVGEPDRSKRFKQEVLGPPALLAPGDAYLRPGNTGYMTDSMQQCFVSVKTEPTAVPPPASSATQSSSGNTSHARQALPAASQQYPVLPQAAASAAAAAASALQGLAGPAQQWNPVNDAFSSVAKKHAQAADLQQQRRRAGPVNQWRPGMPLLAGATQQQQQGYPFPASQQRPSGAGGYQSLPGGALAAALQSLLPLPGQLMAAQQMPAAVSMHCTPQLLLPAGGPQQSAGQHALHILQGPVAAAVTPPAATPALVPSAPHATLDRVPAGVPVPAAAAGVAAAGFPAKTTPQHTALAEPPGDRVAAVSAAAGAGIGAGPSSSSTSPDWLKLLTCAVHPHGDSLAIELLLGGQLYKGQLTRVAPAQAAEAPAAMAAATAAAPGHQLLLQQRQPQDQEVLSEVDRSTLLDFAQQREGMCFLCALPFAKQGEGSVAAGQQAAAMPAAAADGDAGTTAAACAAAASAAEGAAACIVFGQGTAGPGHEDSMQQAEQQQQGMVLEVLEGQHSPTAGQGDLMGSLGPAVHWDLGSSCCLSLHKACAEASAKAAAWQQQPHSWQQQRLQQEQGEAAGSPRVQQLLACLARHCCGCDQRAATLHCAAPGCSRWFHVPCVQAMGALQLQDGSCWCSEHHDLVQQQQQQRQLAGPFAAASTAAGAATAADGLSSPEPSQPAGINPSPSFAAALVLQQMRCSKGFDVLLLGPDSEPTGTDSGSNAGSRAGVGGGVAGGLARASAQRRLLEAMPVSNNSNNSSVPPHEQPRQQYSTAGRGQGQSQGAGLYGSTAEGSRQYHLQQQQLGGFGAQGGAVAGPAPATTMLLQRLQQQTGNVTSWQQQQQHVGPIRSPKSAKGRPPLHAPPGKAKGSWNTLGLISAFALAQQQQEHEQQQQLVASHAAAAAAVVSGPTVVVPRVRARKGATHQTMMQ